MSVFCFKQKTAYDMRISDWSSDVCSSDLYFMMGDNRDDSADSRFPLVPLANGGGVGFVPAENVVGRAAIMIFSTDGSAEWLKPWTWIPAIRWERIGRTFVTPCLNGRSRHMTIDSRIRRRCSTHHHTP